MAKGEVMASKDNAPDFIPDDEMPDFIPDEVQLPPAGFIKSAPLLSALSTVGQAVDPYTGAPTRAAIAAGIKGESPVSAAASQFGRPTSQAPTGEDIARMLGVGEGRISDIAPILYSETGEGLPLQRRGVFDPSAAQIAGLGIDVAADPTNLIGVMPMARRAATPVAKAGVRVAKAVPAAGAGAIDLAMMQSPARVMRGETAARRAVEAVGDKASRAMESVSRVTSPKQVEDFARMSEMAKSLGISPEDLPAAVEFGPTSFISRAERAVVEGPAGERKLTKFTEAASKVDDAIKQTVTGGKPVETLDVAGRKFIDAYNDAVDTTLKNADITYKKVQKYAPGLYLDRDASAKLETSLNGIEKRAKGMIKEGLTKTEMEQGRQLIRTVGVLRNSKGSFKKTVDALDRIGKTAFKKTYEVVDDVPPLVGEMQKLYFDTRDAIINTVDKHVSKDFAKELVQNNAIISDLLKNEKRISTAISNSTPAERRLAQLFADTDSIAAAKKILPKEQFDGIASNYIMSTIPRNADGDVMFGSLAKWIRKEEPKLRSMMDADKLARLKDLSEFGNRFGTSVLSTSGTGASNSFRNVIEGIFNGEVTDTVIESMKARARGKALPKPTGMRAVEGAAREMVPGAFKPSRFLGKRDNQLSQFLKGSQVIGVQGEAEERRNRRLKALDWK